MGSWLWLSDRGKWWLKLAVLCWWVCFVGSVLAAICGVGKKDELIIGNNGVHGNNGEYSHDELLLVFTVFYFCMFLN